MVILCPTRQRNHKHLELCENFLSHSDGRARLVFVLDRDDSNNYERKTHSQIEYYLSETKRRGMADPLNDAARHWQGEDVVGFIGDDHRIRTEGFEAEVYGHYRRHAVIYGNDLLQGENLPTQVFLDGAVIRCLGWMCPPAFQHLFIDDFWKALGTGLGTLTYVPELVIEHMHYSTGKSEVDEIYREVNSLYWQDRTAFNDYLHSGLARDVEKLRNHQRGMPTNIA